jgi:hypothetical protein
MALLDFPGAESEVVVGGRWVVRVDETRYVARPAFGFFLPLSRLVDSVALLSSFTVQTCSFMCRPLSLPKIIPTSHSETQMLILL